MEYKPNSNKYKTEQAEKESEKKEIKQVASGKKYKKPKVNKFANAVFGEDTDYVKSYIFGDIIVPYIKKTLSDVVNAILFPNGDGPKRGNTSRVSYQNYYNNGSNSVKRNMNAPSQIYEEVYLESRGEAEEVLDTLDEILSVYGQVSVNDLYDLVGMTGVHTGNNYGWDNLRNARWVRAGEGYVLKMPKVKPL